MSKRFELCVELDNDAMRTQAHVADALYNLAIRMRMGGVKMSDGGKIKDTNGNSCGEYKLVKEGEK